MATDLEALRQILGDQKLHILLGLVTKVAVASDRSVCQVMVSILPEKREIVCKMSWDAVGDEAGFYMLPNVNDLVIVGQAEGSADDAFVLKRLSSISDRLPLNAVNGDMVAKAISGKKVWISSDTRINLSKGDGEPTENLVLGQIFKTLMSSFLEKVAQHTHIGNLGYATTPPDNAAEFTALKASPVDNGNVLSSIAFTEKGT